MNKRVIAILLSILTLSMIALTGCSEKASDYTEKEHIARVTALAKKRYIDNGDYDSLEVYPLYDENDRLGYFLIELEPAGHVYVRLNDKEVYGNSLYTIHGRPDKAWIRYQPEKGAYAEWTVHHNKIVGRSHCRATEVDDNDCPISHYESHFEAVKIHDERRYLIKIKQNGTDGLIPAVKRNDRYLNLVSLEDFIYERKIEDVKYATAFIEFVSEHGRNNL